MKEIFLSVDELEAIIQGAVQTALDSREKKEGETILVSRDEAARRLGVNVSTLWRWTKLFLQPIKVGRRTFFTERSISLLEHGKIENL